MNDDQLHEVTRLIQANVSLSEVLAQSQREVLARADSFNTGEAASWRRACHWMMALNIGLIIVGAVGAYLLVHRMDAVEASGVVAATEALNANAKADALELKLDDQAEFNETVLQAFEEIKTKWTQSPTKQKR
jgi:hypothetical protein